MSGSKCRLGNWLSREDKHGRTIRSSVNHSPGSYKCSYTYRVLSGSRLGSPSIGYDWCYNHSPRRCPNNQCASLGLAHTQLDGEGSDSPVPCLQCFLCPRKAALGLGGGSRTVMSPVRNCAPPSEFRLNSNGQNSCKLKLQQ